MHWGVLVHYQRRGYAVDDPTPRLRASGVLLAKADIFSQLFTRVFADSRRLVADKTQIVFETVVPLRDRGPVPLAQTEQSSQANGACH